MPTFFPCAEFKVKTVRIANGWNLDLNGFILCRGGRENRELTLRVGDSENGNMRMATDVDKTYKYGRILHMQGLMIPPADRELEEESDNSDYVFRIYTTKNDENKRKYVLPIRELRWRQPFNFSSEWCSL